MTVHAPFRFAPINRWVYFPEWAPLVSHDVPFKDGLSGEITIEIEAKTPLLVGGPRRKATEAREGEVLPFRLPDDRYAIPGSSLQGMVRSILEIAAFGKLGPWVDDRRFAFRDIGTSATAVQFYRSRMTTSVGMRVSHFAKPGWLFKKDGTPVILPCETARIPYSELRALRGPLPAIPDPLNNRSDASVRYNWFVGTGGIAALDRTVYRQAGTWHPHSGGIQIFYEKAFAGTTPGGLRTSGTIVITGKPTDGMGPHRKKMEFVFHTPDRPSALTSPRAPLAVSKDVWRDFLLIHAAQPGRDENPNWSFWKDEYQAGNAIPVFYLESGGSVQTFGTAFMFKTAMPLSTHDMLRNSASEHVPLADDAGYDLPSLILGAVADERGEQGLKRRASFDTAIVTGKLRPLHQFSRAILLGPKAAFYPIYVRQPSDPQQQGRLDNSKFAYAVYSPSTVRTERERKSPELAGVKVWPARDRVSPAGHAAHLADKLSIQTTLRGLAAGTKLETKLRFHNLRPVELGAVLWALSYGKPEAWTDESTIGLRHHLGMGKPYGFGEVSVRLKAGTLTVIANDPQAVPLTVATLVSNFTTEMGRHVADWANQPQLRTIFAAADAEFGRAANVAVPKGPTRPAAKAFDYMELNTDPGGWNDFSNAKAVACCPIT